MRISVQTARILRGEDYSAAFAKMQEAGFGGVDLNIDAKLKAADVENGVFTDFFTQDDERILAAFAPCKEAAQYGLRITQAHAPFGRTNDPAMLDYLLLSYRKSLMICAYLDCPYLVVHPIFQPGEDPQERYRYNFQRYASLIPDIKKYHVTVCLENLFYRENGEFYGGVCYDMEEAIRYIDALNALAGERSFAFCYDTGHCNLLKKDPWEQITQLGSRLAILHLHDNHGFGADSHLTPYMGTVDWTQVLRGLKEIDYRGDLSFETFGTLKTFPECTHTQCLTQIAAVGDAFRAYLTDQQSC